MNSDQYIVTVFSFKKSKNSHPKVDMDSSFNSSVSTNYGPPLDYSFRNISSLEKLERHRPPRQSLRKQVSSETSSTFVSSIERERASNF